MLALLRTPRLEETASVQLVVPMKFPHRTVKLIAARLSDHTDLGARVVAVLGRERGRLDSDFLDSIGRRWVEPGCLREIREVGTVQREIVLPPGGPMNDQGRTATRAAHLLGGLYIRNPWKRARQFHDVSAVERQFLNSAVVNKAGHGRAPGFHQRCSGGHFHHFLELTQIHLEIDSQILSGGQLRGGSLGGEPGQLGLDLVVPPRHREQVEEARLVRDCRTSHLLTKHGGLHVNARDDGAAFVTDVAADRPCDLGFNVH